MKGLALLTMVFLPGTFAAVSPWNSHRFPWLPNIRIPTIDLLRRAKSPRAILKSLDFPSLATIRL